MCKYCDDIKRITFDEDLSESEKLAMINEETHKQIIIEQLEKEDIGVSFEELGITYEDVKNAEGYEINDEDLKIGFSDKKKDEFKVTTLYLYDSNAYGSKGYGANSREFCISLAKRSRTSMMRYQDILRLNGSNPGFGQEGSNTYSIFLYRGGANCRHFWTRYYYDSEAQKIVKAPNQPKQIDKGQVGYAPK